MTGIDEVSKQIGSIQTSIENITTSMNDVSKTLTEHVTNSTEFRSSEARKNDARDTRVATMEKTLADHQKIASQINPEHIPEINKNHAYIKKIRERADFWKAFRIKMLEKGMLAFFAVVGLLMLSWFNDGARNALIRYLNLQ